MATSDIDGVARAAHPCHCRLVVSERYGRSSNDSAASEGPTSPCASSSRCADGLSRATRNALRSRPSYFTSLRRCDALRRRTGLGFAVAHVLCAVLYVQIRSARRRAPYPRAPHRYVNPTAAQKPPRARGPSPRTEGKSSVLRALRTTRAPHGCPQTASSRALLSRTQCGLADGERVFRGDVRRRVPGAYAWCSAVLPTSSYPRQETNSEATCARAET
ncbi:hypothetical protein PYCCODRAFT_123220 [Trametes coccinea BRFM310]|uniref:Uncharacterized protein n=1 Tax=Trametes coccinea (strain BRFM310) TaxID=1353009 RepID=A0A1Y2I765_TRAC3|nr:hypothetical protein PYCCODRAFT_123220 [Trametes coccinea BRFM310]